MNRDEHELSIERIRSELIDGLAQGRYPALHIPDRRLDLRRGRRASDRGNEQ